MTPHKHKLLLAAGGQLSVGISPAGHSAGRLGRTSSGVISLIAFVMFMTVPLRASDITFFDLTDTVVGSVSDPSRMSLGSCGFVDLAGEGCDAFILAPAGATSFSTTLPAHLIIGGPGDVVFSDQLTTNSMFSTNPLEFSLEFRSTFNEVFSSPATCSSLGGCQLTEDGTVQLAGTITWNDAAHTVDTVHFQSDVEPVPEPGALLLLGTGLLGVVGAARRKWLG